MTGERRGAVGGGAPKLGRAARLALLLSLAPVALAWIRGGEPELEPRSEADTATAAALITATVATLSGSPDASAAAAGRWYVSVYPRAGGEPQTVLAEGPASSWAPALAAAWPGKVQVDRALDDPPGPRRWLLRLGLYWSVDVGIDGWIEESGRIHLPVSFVIAGHDRSSLGRFLAEHPGTPLRTQAWVQAPPGPLPMLRHSVQPGLLTAELVHERVALGAHYLRDHLRADGLYDYEWDPRSGEPRQGDYSLLRHAGTTYSLFQSSAFRAGEGARAAAVRGLELLRERTRHAQGEPARCYLEDGDQVPLGGAALALLALTEQARHRPADADRDWMRCLGEHLCAETDDRGDMRSFYAEPGRHRASDARSIYYPGEAVLALTRLNQVDPSPRWLDTALRAARYLIHERHVALGVRVDVPPDAWLLQALEELQRLAAADDLVDYAFAIAAVMARDQLAGSPADDHAPADLLGSTFGVELPRVIAAGSRLEGLAAAARLERRVRPGSRFFLDRALLAARFSLRNQYTSEILFGVAPGALGGFRSAVNDPVIRIDGVQHNSSGLLGLLELLEER